MAKPSKSKNPSEADDGVLDADADSDLDAGKKSPSIDNVTGDKEAKTAKRLTSKRRKVVSSCTSSEHSRAVELVASNEDLLTEIISFLPAKPLLKFKSVSKHWRSLISDVKFTSNHACRNPSSSLISGLYFYHRPWVTFKSVSLHGHLSLPTLAFLDPVLKGSESRVEDSCNGLLLFSNGGKKEYIVCNPTTQKYIALPQHGDSTTYTYSHNFGAYLAFDPSKSPYYKVVLLSYHCGYVERSRSYRIYIYSSESASWKEVHVKAPIVGPYGRRVFWNGAIHWMSHDDNHILFESFNIDAEILTGTQTPKVPNILNGDKIQYFGECGGSLLLIQSREYSAMGFRILEMKKDCCRWIVKCRVNLRPIRSVFPEGYCPEYCVLCCVNGANGKDFTLVFVIPGKVIAYDLNSKAMKVLLDLHGDADSPSHYSYYQVYQFIESLSPI
ncbi:F-box protein At5g07610-like [Rhododendron vialii]|uniref:F-box protein At5g07610-like n=1 Tax=Rhododendron vialii TaxID=182163 RepID=UPI00265F5298|nr:F-box protein At5g07610-like [Rhododendron vialii]